MPFRFRKTLSLGKGIRLNLGKTGASFSLGGKGATVNLGKRGIRTTLGIPGTGISYTQSTPSTNLDSQENQDNESFSPILSRGEYILALIQLFFVGIQLLFYLLLLFGMCSIAYWIFFGI